MNSIPYSLIALFYLCICLPISAQIDESKRYNEKEVEVETKFVEASRQLVLGQYEKAIELYTDLLKKDKENGTLHFQLSRCYEALKNYEKASFHGEKAVALNPTNEFFTMQLAESYEGSMQYDQAAKAYLNFGKQNPKDPFFYERAVYFYLQNNDTDNAISTLKIMEKNLGVDESISKQLHEIYAKTGDEKNAVKALEKLAKTFPDVSRYQLNLANYYVQIGEQKKANKILAKYGQELIPLGSSPKNISTDNRIQLVKLVRNEIPQDNITIDQKITKLIPILQSLNENFDKSLGDELLLATSELVEKYGENPKSHALSADVFFAMDDTDSAIAAYKKTIQLNSSVFDVWYQLMSIQKEQNLIDDLFETSDQALLRFPNQAIAYLFNAYSLNRKLEPEDAFDLLQEAVLMSGNNKELSLSIQTEMAYSKFLQQEYDTAMKILDTEPIQTAAAYDLRGDILMKQGKQKKAIENWKKALQLSPDTKSIQVKIQNSQS